MRYSGFGKLSKQETTILRVNRMNKQELLDKVAKSSLKTDPPKFDIGDTVDVHTKMLEGEKERIQIFWAP